MQKTDTRPQYQLTQYAIGTLREIWAVSWPLMLGLLSGSLMFFADRLILAHYSIAGMNAAANGGLASWGMMILPIVIAETTEVFVGRYNGEGNLKNVPKPVWQMLWLSLFSAPIYWIGSRLLAPILFYGTGNTQFESEYFIAVCDFGPCFVGSIALAGFFIGTGRVKIVTYTMIIANLLNIGLDFLLVFGFVGLPPLGCTGAGFATGLSQAFQMAIYLVLFLSKENREKYGTASWNFDVKLVWEFLKIAVPSGVGRCIEVVAHLVFFRIMIMSGPDVMTCVTLVQSLYLLMCFIIDGLAKGTTAVVSNIFGANQKPLLARILKSACSMHILLTGIIAVILLGFTEQIASGFFSEQERVFLQNAEFLTTLKKATLWMTIFFLFDGFCWIFVGLFTAAGDTKFVMYVNAILNWLAYVLPVYIVMRIYNGSADHAWMILAFYNVTIFSIYLLRYRLKIVPLKSLIPEPQAQKLMEPAESIATS